MGNTPYSTLVVGSYVQDHVWLTDEFPKAGETRRALGFSTGPGGKGFNQAVACSRQDGNVVFIGAIGADALGEHARACAVREGLACEWQVVECVPTAAAGIIVDASGANRIMVNLAANEHLDTQFLESREQHFSGARVLLVQLENPLEVVRAALGIASRHGLLRVLNPAPMHADVDAALLADCDLVTPNETEFVQLLERIAGLRVSPNSLATTPDSTLHEYCRKLGVASCVITLGASGCFVSHAPGQWRGDTLSHYRLPAEAVKAIDTTGAGDAFSGALVAALSATDGIPFRDAVRQANRVAALSTEKPGAALAIPSRAEVMQRFGDPAGPLPPHQPSPPAST